MVKNSGIIRTVPEEFDDVSFTCLIPSDDVADEVLENAFHDTAAHEGIWYKIEPYALRKKVVVPTITNVLLALF